MLRHVRKLIEPAAGQCRNVTSDKVFASLMLSEELEAKKTIIVGNRNRIRIDIPDEIKAMKPPLYSNVVLQS